MPTVTIRLRIPWLRLHVERHMRARTWYQFQLRGDEFAIGLPLATIIRRHAEVSVDPGLHQLVLEKAFICFASDLLSRGDSAHPHSSITHYILRQIPSLADLASSSAASNSAEASGVARAPPLLKMTPDKFCPSTLQRKRSGAPLGSQITSRRLRNRESARTAR